MSSCKKLTVAGKEYPLIMGEKEFLHSFVVRQPEPLPLIVGGDWEDYPSVEGWSDENPPPEPGEYKPPKVRTHNGGRQSTGLAREGYEGRRTLQDEIEIEKRVKKYAEAYATLGGWKKLKKVSIDFPSPLPGVDTRPASPHKVRGLGVSNPSMRLLHPTRMSNPHMGDDEVDNS